MSTRHEEIESLLGAYALDAVDPEESLAIEEHLATCPRCRAEVAEFREAASALGNSGAAAPSGLWERIADELAGASAVDPPRVAFTTSRHRSRRTRRRVIASAIVAMASVSIILLGLQVANLDNQVHHLQSPQSIEVLASTVAAVLEEPHTTIDLASATSASSAQIIVAKDGTAYWIASDLQRLAPSQTYQLWGAASGQTISLGLLGSNPSRYSAFRLARGITSLMVTAEPMAGTATPTTAVLVSASIHNAAY